MTDNAKREAPLVIKAQHTLGPWVVFHVDGVNDICPAMRPGSIAENVMGAADARLIAAAPEMFEALRGLLSVIDGASGGPAQENGIIDDAQALVDRLEAGQ